MLHALPKFKKSDVNYELSKKLMNEVDLLGGIDGIKDINDDKAYALAEKDLV